MAVTTQSGSAAVVVDLSCLERPRRLALPVCAADIGRLGTAALRELIRFADCGRRFRLLVASRIDSK